MAADSAEMAEMESSGVGLGAFSAAKTDRDVDHSSTSGTEL